MSRIKSYLFISLLILPLASPGFAAESLRISGTGAALGVMKLLSCEFKRKNPAIEVTILPSMGSGGGIKAVRAGALDIGLSSRVLSWSERDLAQYEYGRTPFVFTVSKNAPVQGFTLGEIESIYTGKTARWPDGVKIRPILRPATESDTVILESMSGNTSAAVERALSQKGMIVEVTDQENADAIEKIPGAIGTATLGQIIAEKRRLKPLALDGVAPTRENMASGRYPHFKTHYLVVKKNPGAAVRKFIDFVFSGSGRTILMQSGYEPTKR